MLWRRAFRVHGNQPFVFRSFSTEYSSLSYHITITQSLTYLIDLTRVSFVWLLYLPFLHVWIHTDMRVVRNGIAVKIGNIASQQKGVHPHLVLLISSLPHSSLNLLFRCLGGMDCSWAFWNVDNQHINEKNLKSDQKWSKKGIESKQIRFLSSDSGKGTFTFQARVLAHQDQFYGDDLQLSEAGQWQELIY